METPLPLPQGLRRLFSPQVLVGALRDIVSRFTLTFVFACLDTLYCIFFILFPKVLPDITETAIVEALALGTLLTLASYLWGEYFGKKKFTAIALTLSVMAAAANFIVVVLHIQALNSAHFTGYASAVVACVVAIAFTPPLGHTPMSRRWLYTMKVVRGTLLTLCIQIVLSIALLIINTTLSVLFGIYEHKLFECLIVIFGGFIPALAFLHMLPHPREEEQPDSLCRTLAAFCKNILLPLALVYMVILYVYTIKIIATWSLPNGQITWMVTGIVSVVLVTVYGLQGIPVRPRLQALGQACGIACAPLPAAAHTASAGAYECSHILPHRPVRLHHKPLVCSHIQYMGLPRGCIYNDSAPAAPQRRRRIFCRGLHCHEHNARPQLLHHRHAYSTEPSVHSAGRGRCGKIPHKL